MKYYGKAESVASRILEHFQTGNIPKALAPIFIRGHDNIPCRAWSWANQLIRALAGYDDARSYLEWQKVGRSVRKGEHGFPILEPCKRKVRENDSETGEAIERMVCYGFHVGIRFGYEQTDGEPLPDRDHAADDRLGTLTERGQHWASETVAELGGAVLLCCVGRDHDADLGGCWQYIQRYAEDNGKEPIEAAMAVLNRICKAVALVLEAADELTVKGVAA